MRLLSSDIALKVSRSATAAAAAVIKKQAVANIKSNASKNQTSVDTGSLRDAVVVKRLTKSPLTSEHIVAVRRRKSGRKTKTKQATAPHASMVEFGTVNMPAEPFMRPAYDHKKEAALDAMVNKLKQRIQKAGG